ncbi:MAG TPA: dihydrolipoamide acetyltransferase family protein [Actinomycetes bacterium]|nr:dihydrolipoamide acetyltransferase family protein [Actinomycetes bacterium]
MSETRQFTLPDVGEGLTEAEIVSWKVKPGDAVKVNDVIVEIETAKSLVELPCPWAGTISELLVAEGQTVEVGAPIVAVAIGEGASAGSAGSAASAPSEPVQAATEIGEPKPDQAVEPGLIGGPAPGGRTSVLVGYGPRTTEAKRRPRAGAHAAAPTPTVIKQSVPAPAAPAPAPAAPAAAGPVLAKPPVRKLAKDHGIDLRTVTPTGAGGIVTRADVEAAVEGATEPSYDVSGLGRPAAAGERETRIPIKSVRKVMAEAMVRSAFTAPHVTEWVSVDVTRMMALVKRLRALPEFAEVRVGPLTLVARALILAVRRNPLVNASWDEAAGEVVVKNYVNLGIAAATPRGLVVPNIKDADRLTLAELATALSDLAHTARAGKTPPADMLGGTISITNVGVFGVDSGTPILPPGESAILAFGQVRELPWVHRGKVKPRQVTQLALSFDHRLIDGELGSKFLADIARLLEDPGLALAYA